MRQSRLPCLIGRLKCFQPRNFTTGERKIFGSWKSRPAPLIDQSLLRVKAFFKDQVDVVKNEADSSVELSINLRSRVVLPGSNLAGQEYQALTFADPIKKGSVSFLKNRNGVRETRIRIMLKGLSRKPK
jgi:hypothetical protein